MNLLKGIEDAFNERWEEMVLYAYKILRDREEAEDAVQDIFVKILQSGCSIDKFPLFKMVHDHCCNLVTKKEVRERYLKKMPEPQIEEYTGIDPEVVKYILSRVNKLTDHGKQIITLKYYHNLTSQQIADKLNLSKWTVNNLLVYYYKRMRLELKKTSFNTNLL